MNARYVWTPSITRLTCLWLLFMSGAESLRRPSFTIGRPRISILSTRARIRASLAFGRQHPVNPDVDCRHENMAAVVQLVATVAPVCCADSHRSVMAGLLQKILHLGDAPARSPLLPSCCNLELPMAGRGGEPRSAISRHLGRGEPVVRPTTTNIGLVSPLAEEAKTHE